MITGPLFTAYVGLFALLMWLMHDDWGVEDRDV